MSSLQKPSSSSLRFLGLLRLPEPDLDSLELSESDVVWSPDFSRSPDALSRSPSTGSNSPTGSRHNHRQFRPGSPGRSVVRLEDRRPLVRRKPNLNPSLSAATAAKTIPPVSLHRRSESYGYVNFPQSAPINVPIWPINAKEFNRLGRFDEVDDEVVDEEEMIPPHEIVARSHVTFSVFEGAGRTLKGRDLHRVRNSVFQKTGFID